MKRKFIIFFSVSLLSVLLLSACYAKPAESTPAGTNPTPGVSFRNPVFNADFPDPFVLEAGGKYYAYATNGNGRRIQVAVSDDLITWALIKDAMPSAAKWATSQTGLTWAPEVMKINEMYMLYYTSRDIDSNKQCVGVATSDKPEGPFKDISATPLVCQAKEGGTIDASPFRDGDKVYLYFKNDGNCCGMPTHIYVQEMAPDGLRMVGEPTALLVNDQSWEGHVIEAPTMFKKDGKYYLFFSANNYGDEKYAVGYALCDSPTGPCQDAQENPILKSRTNQEPKVIGPGHQTLFQVGDQTWIFYHAWNVDAQGKQGGQRYMWLDQVGWKDGKPVVQGPTTGLQFVPKVSK